MRDAFVYGMFCIHYTRVSGYLLWTMRRLVTSPPGGLMSSVKARIAKAKWVAVA
jgi:hypothetical protein